MRRILVLVLTVALTTVMAVGAVAADPPRATPAGRAVVHMSRLTNELNQLQAIQQRAGKVKCRSLQCINHALTVLNKRTIGLGNFLNRYIKCQRLVRITQYADYLATDGVTPLTGLDFTATGDSASRVMLVWVC